jgi:hypothetical protein
MVVVAGIGEVVDRGHRETPPPDPATLMADACEQALRDAGLSPSAIDHLSVVNSISWRYADLPDAVMAKVGLRASSDYGVPGGETPLRFVHRAAARIRAGQSRAELICGGEASYSARRAADPVSAFGWPAAPPAAHTPFRPYLHPLAHRTGLVDPVGVYPLYENALLAWQGLPPGEAHQQSARLWSGLSAVAADNPAAWRRDALDAREIAEVSAANRLIAWPYTRNMVANPQVNQAGALLVMSRAAAREAGMAVERMVTIAFAAEASEPRDYLARDVYHRSASMEAVLAAAQADAGGSPPDFVELYSCFPCVPKMAQIVLGRDRADPISVAGGLGFFGGPYNNYMTHAVAAAVRRLRAAPDAHGLLYGQGEFVTKNFVLRLIGGRRSEPARFDDDSSRQADADARRGPVPPVVEGATGAAVLETFTALFGRDGRPGDGIVIARLADGGRTMALLPKEDGAAMDRLFDSDRSPVGARGHLSPGPNDISRWSFA